MHAQHKLVQVATWRLPRSHRYHITGPAQPYAKHDSQGRAGARCSIDYRAGLVGREKKKNKKKNILVVVDGQQDEEPSVQVDLAQL